VRQGCRGTLKIAILPQFLAIEPDFVRQGCRGHFKIAILPEFLAIEPHFVRKGQSVFGDRTSFRAKGCVSCRLVGTAPRRKKEK